VSRTIPSVDAERVPCSVVIAAKNEADEIADCIASVAWAAEVIVVENDSTDDTVAIATGAGAVAFSHPFTTIGRQRNAAIARARHEWILVVDADERGTPQLRDEVARVVARSGVDVAFRVRRRNIFLDREIRHGGWERDRPVRLFRSRMRYDERPVHEHVITDGVVGELSEPLIHFPYASLAEYFAKLDRYSRWWSEQSFARGRRTSAWTIAVRPPARFVSMYVLRLGFLDGARGVIVAALAAMSVAAKYARLWELQRGAVTGKPRPETEAASAEQPTASAPRSRFPVPDRK
jgi:glycosyltransferase involved in cell wall biosynthesis